MSNESLFHLNPDPEEVRIGVVYSGLAVIIVPVHLVLNYVMLFDKDLNQSPLYNLMVQINLVEFGQIIFHFISGFFPIFPNILRRLPVFVRICGATANSLWLGMFPVMCILSVSRILVIHNKMSATKMGPSLKISLALGWLYTVVIWLWCCIGQNFTFEGVGWTYDFSKYGSATLASLELYLCFPSLLISYGAYLIIVVRMMLLRGTMSDGSSRLTWAEVRVFLQSTFLTMYAFALITLWHNAAEWLPATKTIYCFLNSCWIFFSFVNPILSLALNRTVRDKVAAILLCKPANTVNVLRTRTSMVASHVLTK